MDIPKSLAPVHHCLLLIVSLWCITALQAQDCRPLSAAELQHRLGAMRVVGNVMYLAAHPDDENTQLIAHFALRKGYRTTYLSLTRGDGGQNLIGTEKGPLIGVLRTQELLAARRIDGAHQLFTRAYDFGYSKSASETLNVWDRQQILSDIVWAIRNTRPDVVITRFAGPEKGGGGHGHHTASAMLAKEAVVLAADPQAFPSQLEWVQTWRPTRLVWNCGRPRQGDEKQLAVQAGGYLPLLGKELGEIAGESRSMHRCQAMGTRRSRGPRTEWLEHEIGLPATADLFDGIDTTWNRIEGGEPINRLIQTAYQEFDPTHPAGIVHYLLKAVELVESSTNPLAQQRLDDLKILIAQCAGLWMEARSPVRTLAQDQSLDLNLHLVNRGETNVRLTHLRCRAGDAATDLDVDQEITEHETKVTVKWHAQGAPFTQPYWMTRPPDQGMFSVANQQWIGLPETPLRPFIEATLEISDLPLTYQVPVVHYRVEPAIGEVHEPFTIAPPVTVTWSEKMLVFARSEPRQIEFTAQSHRGPGSQSLYFSVPTGWSVFPTSVELNFEGVTREISDSVRITPPDSIESAASGELVISLDRQHDQEASSLVEVNYDHIPRQTVFSRAVLQLVAANVKTRGQKIGYLMGAGDEVPEALRRLGYSVDVLEDQDVRDEILEQYDAIVAGVRVYNVNRRMPQLQKVILQYVQRGGRYIVQYNTSWGISTQQPGPFPLSLSRDRVTVEDAPVRFLDAEHVLLSSPNRITPQDFSGWVQERGLYFPNRWDDRYVPIIQTADPGEKTLKGSLLYARHGKGVFIYTGLSFFRQLPAGVPGAYRLFANLVSPKE